ncbi:3-oxoadipate CoA-transferase subunit B [Acinetobacter baumannii TCDC-AB0715]|nr:3-oxoadipate CoA-transferase subunit B [Acinetobacter baumannii TCDC-AB0715]
MSYQKLSRDQIAKRVAQDIPDGAYVNLGIGLPTKIASYLPADKDVFLHSENGLLAFGPPQVFITTDHITKQGEPKIVAELTYPVTGKHCVDRIYTDLCVIDVTKDGLKVIEKVEGLSFDELQALTGATLIDATQG